MKILVFMGSPRKNGDTATLLKSFLTELEIKGAEVKTIFLYDKKIAPCLECFQCQDKLGEYGCSIQDDMYDISDEILKADCFILASPIYIWYCTAPMKAMLDRFLWTSQILWKTTWAESAGRKKVRNNCYMWL